MPNTPPPPTALDAEPTAAATRQTHGQGPIATAAHESLSELLNPPSTPDSRQILLQKISNLTQKIQNLIKDYLQPILAGYNLEKEAPFYQPEEPEEYPMNEIHGTARSLRDKIYNLIQELEHYQQRTTNPGYRPEDDAAQKIVATFEAIKAECQEEAQDIQRTKLQIAVNDKLWELSCEAAQQGHRLRSIISTHLPLEIAIAITQQIYHLIKGDRTIKGTPLTEAMKDKQLLEEDLIPRIHQLRAMCKDRQNIDFLSRALVAPDIAEIEAELARIEKTHFPQTSSE